MIDFLFWLAWFAIALVICSHLRQCVVLLTRIAGLLYENELRERNRR